MLKQAELIVVKWSSFSMSAEGLMHKTNPWSSLHSLMLNHLSQDDSRLIGINYIFEMSDDTFLKKIGQKLFIRWDPVFYTGPPQAVVVAPW